MTKLLHSVWWDKDTWGGGGEKKNLIGVGNLPEKEKKVPKL